MCLGLKISLLQQPLVWMDGPANLRHFDRQLEGITGRDVIVLPEMFTTGFCHGSGKTVFTRGRRGGVDACPGRAIPRR